MLFLYFRRSQRTLLPQRKHLKVQKHQRYLVCCLLIPKYVLCTAFLHFLSCRYINHTYPVAVYTLNTRRAPYCFFLSAQNVPFIFDVMVWTSKHQSYLFSIFEISKYVRRYLVCRLFASKYVLLLLCWNLICNWMIGTYLVAA